MKTFHEWLQEGAGIATRRSACKQNSNTPNFAGACSDLPETTHKKKKLKKEASIVGDHMPKGVGKMGQAGTDAFPAGAMGGESRKRSKKSKPKMD
jgi:hypothetical protein